MPITDQDIKLLKSERMTDTTDGGGRMTGQVVNTGVDNNIFDDVSGLDRVYGNVSIREIFGAVQTTDTDKYLGARVVIDQAPIDPNVHCLLFAVPGTYEVREQTQTRIESYLAPGAPLQGLLYGPHIIGMKTVTLIQQPNQTVPDIGDVLLLRQTVASALNEQFCRVTAVATSAATFTDDAGDFVRSIIVCAISDLLRHDFTGFEASRITTGANFVGFARVFDTVVADAAQYYGIRPLETAATTGDFSIKADTAYSTLLPSAQIETPLVDLMPNSERVILSAAGGPVVVSTAVAFGPNNSLAVGQGITPGSLTVAVPGAVLTDSGGTLRASGVQVGTVDYVNGVLSVSDPAANYPGSKTITYTPAAAPVRNMHTASWAVTAATRSSTVVGIFDPIPKPGTLAISYRAQGRWYTISDQGGGTIRNQFADFGSGTINYTTGSMAVTLAALPDNDTLVLATYGLATADTATGGTPLVAESVFDLAHGGVAPSTVSITWLAGGVSKTATDNGTGGLTGDATGTVDYLDGLIKFRPLILPSANTSVSIQYSWGEPEIENFIAPERFPDGTLRLQLAHPNVMPRTVKVEWNTVYDPADLTVEGQISTAVIATSWVQTVFNNPNTDPIVIVNDNGAGAFSTRPECAAVINYTLGTVRFVPETTVAFPRPKWGFVVTGTNTSQVPAGAGVQTTVLETRKAVFGGFEYQNIGAEFPADLSGYVKVSYRTTAAGSTNTETFTLAMRADITNGSGEPIVPGSLGFVLGGTRYIDRQGSLIKDIDPATGAGTTAGTVNYSTGIATVSALPVGQANTGAVIGVITQQSPMPVTDVQFRTSAAPLRVGSLRVQFVLADDNAQTSKIVTTNPAGRFDTVDVQGSVNFETGVVEMYFGQWRTAAGNESQPWYDVDLIKDGKIWVAKSVMADTIRYAAVAYTYLPLDADILGLDPVRLPSDGRVPIFKAGRVVLVHNTQNIAPQTVANGQTVNTGRVRLARLRVLGADGNEITTGFGKNLDAGTVTFTNIAGMSQPVSIEHRIEDEALCAEAQITGDLRLTRQLTHDFPAPGSYVSSALVVGTRQAASQRSFAQAAWTGEWSNAAIGASLLAQYNDTIYPIEVSNIGAITERWALIFNNNTTFRVVGELSGQILQANTGEVCAPINPATGTPYFELDPAGWGTGWVAGNLLRFNTVGATWPMAVIRTVVQSPAAPPGTDQITLSIRGDIDV